MSTALITKGRWFWNRLRCMTPLEVLHRGRQTALTRLSRHGLLSNAMAAPQLDACPPVAAWDMSGFDSGAYLREADLILNGQVPLFATATFQVGARPEWNRDPLTGVLGPAAFGPSMAITDRALVGDIKHVWELNRHLHLVRLAQAYCLSGEPRYGAALANQLADWLAQCPPSTGPNWSSSLELGIRLINWSLIWRLIGGAGSALFADAAGCLWRDAWLSSIHAHCVAIARHLSRHSSANNHLIGELAGLYVAAQTWPCWPGSARWRRQAQRELEQQAVLQHAADGVNREQAFSYQVFTAEFLIVAGIAGARAGAPFTPAYWAVIERGLQFTRAVRDVGGQMPMVGDADDGIVFRLETGGAGDRPAMLLELGAAVFGAPGARSASARWLLAELPALAEPQPPRPHSDWNFAAGGYLLFGSDFGAADEIKGMVDCGPLGYLGIAAHGHADALGLTLSIAGQQCLVDPGTYSYWQALQWRDYFRGTAAHNTLRVDGLDQSVSGGRFMWTRKAATRVERMPDSAADFELVASHDGYRRLRDPVRHRRQVTFDAAARRLTVRDDAESRLAHLLEQHWHFAPGLQVTLSGRVAQVRGRRFMLEIEFAGAGVALSLVEGQSTPPLGWFSRCYEHKEPSPTLVVANNQAGASIVAQFTIDIFK